MTLICQVGSFGKRFSLLQKIQCSSELSSSTNLLHFYANSKSRRSGVFLHVVVRPQSRRNIRLQDGSKTCDVVARYIFSSRDHSSSIKIELIYTLVSLASSYVHWEVLQTPTKQNEQTISPINGFDVAKWSSVQPILLHHEIIGGYGYASNRLQSFYDVSSR